MIKNVLERRRQDAQRLRTTVRNHRELVHLVLFTGLLLVALGMALANARSDDAQRLAFPGPPPITSTGASLGPRNTRPGGGGQPAPPAPPSPAAHTVARGETLAGIALRYQVPFEQLAAANGLADHNLITVGQRLTIQPRARGLEVIEPGTTLTAYARRFGLSLRDLAALNPQITDVNRLPAGGSLRITGRPS